MRMKDFGKRPIKKKAGLMHLHLLPPPLQAIDSIIKALLCLFAKQKALLACVLAAVMVFTDIPYTVAPVSAAESYDHTYTGTQGSLTLTSGNYLLDGATITGGIGQNGITIASGANVTLYIKGSVTVNAGPPAASGAGGKAGIYVPQDASLLIRLPKDIYSAQLGVSGGDGGKAEVCGGGGGGAAIGTNGGSGGIPGIGYGANGGDGQNGDVPGKIAIPFEIKLNLTAGVGGTAHSGYYGSSGVIDHKNNNISGGNGGNGGGGGGARGAELGTGGGGGGAGGNGGAPGYQNGFKNWSECGGGGGGGGGIGYSSDGGGSGGGGGGGGGAAAIARGSDGEVTYGFSGGAKDSESTVPPGARTKAYAEGTFRTCVAECGFGGKPGSGGSGGKTKKNDHPGKRGGDGGQRGKSAVAYSVVEFIDKGGTNETRSYRTVVSHQAIGNLPEPQSRPHYAFEGWFYWTATFEAGIYSAKANESTSPKRQQLALRAKWSELDHTFSYTASGNTITATCTLGGCEYSTGGLTFTIDAGGCNKVYDGKPCGAAKTQNEITAVTGLNAGKITYVSVDGAGYNSRIAPKDAGTYKATATLGEKTASSEFTISKAVLHVLPSSHTISQTDQFPTVTTAYSGFVNGETQSTAGITGTLPTVKFYTDSTKTTELTATDTSGNYVIAYDGTGTLSAKNYSFQFMQGVLTVGDVRAISTAEEFLEFANKVNNGSTNMNAVLKNDIDLSSVCGSSASKNWTPIGTEGKPYTGNFNGNGYTVSNMYINSTANYQGLFGVVSDGAVIQNVILADNCSVTGGDYSAGLIGGSNGTGEILIQNCGNNATVVGGTNASGVFGLNMGSKANITMTNCYNNGAVTASKEGGGLSGWLGHMPVIISCYSTGTVTNGDIFARSVDNKATVENSFTSDSQATAFPVTAVKTADAFASGEVTYLLNKGTTDGSQSWYQKLGEGGDTLPSLTKDVNQKKVYQVKEYDSCSSSAGYALTYRNTPDDITHAHNYDPNGICTVCGEADSNHKTPVNGIYEIRTPGELMWFSAFVNMGNVSANAVLINDIDMDTVKWTGLLKYSGTFDGANHTIRNLCQNAGMADDAKPGFTHLLQTGGVVKNLNITNANIFYNVSGGGGVIAGTNSGTIENVLVTDSIVQYGAYNWLGGIAGINRNTIRNCGIANTEITRRYGGVSNRPLGGVVDANGGTVENCYAYNLSYKNGSATGMAAILASGNEPANSYYFTSSSLMPNSFHEKIGQTDEAFCSGKVTYLLNHGKTDGTRVWYQTAGDGIPHFNGGAAETIYEGYDSCGNTEPVYANKPLKADKPDHTYGGWTDNDDGTHSHTCSKCNQTETLEHSYGGWMDNKDGTHSHSCSTCGKKETFDHTYGDWKDNNNEMHSHSCSTCNSVETAQHTFDKWKDNGNGTHTLACSVCDSIKETANHTFGKWMDYGDGTHICVCACGADEIAGHAFGEWRDCDNGTHIRVCACGANEIAEHTDGDSDNICDDCEAILESISVTITWGSMEFTYADAGKGTWNPTTHTYGNGTAAEWVCDTNANKITITSESNVDLTASFSYETAKDVTVNGSFTDGTKPITRLPIPKKQNTAQTVAAYVKLDGKPSETADEAIMGTVTVTIGGN